MWPAWAPAHGPTHQKYYESTDIAAPLDVVWAILNEGYFLLTQGCKDSQTHWVQGTPELTRKR